MTGALMAVSLMAFLGLAFDVGYVEWTRRHLQIAADSAAAAGAQELLRGSPGNITSAAKNDSALNGATDGVNGVTVTVNHPPASGSYAGDNTAVEAIVVQNTPLFFLRVLGANVAAIQARSVARLGNDGNCMFLLDPSSKNALYLNGAFNINMSCGTMVDSSNSQAMYLNGAINWSGQTDVAGNYVENGAINMSPAPETGALAEGDPLAYVPAPAYGACNYTNYALLGAFNATLSPGVYCNGIKANGAGNITFNPGTYILEGGGFSTIGAINLTGTGVTFYNTQGGGYTYGAISLTGSSNMNLSAPTSGPLAGMLFFQDRSIASPPASSITGASNATLVGAIYFPTSALTYSGSSNGAYTILVADTLTFYGSATVNANYSSLPGGVSPVKDAVALAE